MKPWQLLKNQRFCELNEKTAVEFLLLFSTFLLLIKAMAVFTKRLFVFEFLLPVWFVVFRFLNDPSVSNLNSFFEAKRRKVNRRLKDGIHKYQQEQAIMEAYVFKR